MGASSCGQGKGFGGQATGALSQAAAERCSWVSRETEKSRLQGLWGGYLEGNAEAGRGQGEVAAAAVQARGDSSWGPE